MLRYNAWANDTLFTRCRALDDAALDARAPGASGSVRELLVHIAGGQQDFVARTRGRAQAGGLRRGSPWPGVDALIAIVRQTNDELVAVAEALDEDREVELRYMGRNSRHDVSFFLAHAVGHAAEHRTEIKMTLNAMGVSTPDLDGWAWAGATGRGRIVG